MIEYIDYNLGKSLIELGQALIEIKIPKIR